MEDKVRMDYEEYRLGASREFFWFKAKNELLEIFLRKLHFKRKLKILSVGVGTGEELHVLHKFGIVDALDIEHGVFNLIDKSVYRKKYLVDICALDLKERYDLIIGLDVLEHIEDDEKAIDKIHKHLKKGGYFIFTVPSFNFLFSPRDTLLKHFRRYDPDKIKNLLERRFTIVYFSFWNSLLFFPIVIVRLTRKILNKKLRNIDYNVNKCINKILYIVIKFDNFIIKKNKTLPIGLSIVGICKKWEK